MRRIFKSYEFRNGHTHTATLTVVNYFRSILKILTNIFSQIQNEDWSLRARCINTSLLRRLNPLRHGSIHFRG